MGILVSTTTFAIIVEFYSYYFFTALSHILMNYYKLDRSHFSDDSSNRMV